MLKSKKRSLPYAVELGEDDNSDLLYKLATDTELEVATPNDDFSINTIDEMFAVNEILYAIDESLWPMFSAVIEVDGFNYACNAAGNKFDRYNLFPDITNTEELGRHFLYEGSSIEFDKVPKILIEFFDFEAYGEDIEESGGFTDWGFLECE